MKALIVFFSAVTVFGIFLFLVGVAANHGHFRFRPAMAQDWLFFGTPLLGIIGLALVVARAVRKR
ncbi:MAG TPA: hypothetical protein VF191_04180 [Cyclobacteriaceae bacterium]